MRTQLTLCFIHDEARVLLGMKKRGFGAGKWNGFGGKIEALETAEAAARREVREEIGVEVTKLEPAGELEFVYLHLNEVYEVSVFRALHYTGEPKETEEMRPTWFSVDVIPYNEMWLDDPHWLPLFLSRTGFRGRFVFRDENTLIEYEVERK